MKAKIKKISKRALTVVLSVSLIASLMIPALALNINEDEIGTNETVNSEELNSSNIDDGSEIKDNTKDNTNEVKTMSSTPMGYEAYAVFLEDGRLIFGYDTYSGVPSEGTEYTYDGTTSTILNVYGDLSYTGYSSSLVPWYEITEVTDSVKVIIIDETFHEFTPDSFSGWFHDDYSRSYTFEGLENINTSDATSIDGMFYGCNLTDDNIKEMSSWDVSKILTMDRTFQYCSDITSIEPLENWKTESLTSLSNTFNGCSSLSTLSGLAGWNTSEVTDLSSIFYNCTSLEDISALSSWITTNVESLYDTFGECTCLTTESIEAISNWNVSRVEDMSGVFMRCTGLTSLAPISNWDISNVTTLRGTFDGCTGLESFEIEWKEPENLTNMGLMFYNCSSLSNVKGLANWSVSNVTNMGSIFEGCTNLTDLSALTNWKIDNVSDLSFAFYNCTNLTDLSALENWNGLNVTNLQNTFYNCINLTNVDALSNWNISNVTNLYGTFNSCSSIEKIDLSTWDLSNVTNSTNAFSGCTNLKEISINMPSEGFIEFPETDSGYWYTATGDAYMYNAIPAGTSTYYVDEPIKDAFAVYSDTDKSLTFYYDYVPSENSTYNEKETTKVYTDFLDEQYSDLLHGTTAPWYNQRASIETIEFNESFSVVQPVYLSCWFYDLSELTEFDGKYLDTSMVQQMNGMFHGCTQLENIDVSYLVTSKVTTLDSFFYQCSSLKEITGLDTWDTSSVEDLSGLFRQCTALETIEGISEWDTSNVDDMAYLFGWCSSLKAIAVSSWDVSNVTNMDDTFGKCESLTTLDLSGWDTANLGSSSSGGLSETFQDCTNLETIYTAKDQFKTENVKSFYGGSTFKGCINLIGGNGTEYSEAYVDYTMAHVDGVDGKAGYFTECEHIYTEEITDYTCTDKTDLDSYVFYGSLICMKCNNEIPFTSEDSNVTVTHNGNIDCTDISQITFTIDVNYNNKPYTATDEINIEAEGHKFSGDGYWTLINGQSDNASCVAYYICDVCGEEIPVEDISVSKGSSTAPTCTADGENVFKATGTLDNGIGEPITVEHTLTETLSQLGHEWDEITFIWNEDYNNASAFRTCTRCGDTESASRVSISHRTVNPTCTEAGSIVYTATATFSDGTSATDSKTVELSATGHTWTFNEDDSDSYIISLSGGWMQFILTCSVCGETYTTTRVSLTFETYDTYEGQTGITYCTAKITVGDKEYEFKKNINEVSAQAEQVMNAHAWYEYSTKACTCTTNGVVTYKCSDCGATKDVIETAKGHDWDEDNAQWNWSSNYSKCTVTAKCLVCGHSDTENCTVTTATSGNNTMYTAVATMDDGQTLRTTRAANASALGTNNNGTNTVSSSTDRDSGNDGSGDAVNSDEGTATSVSSTAADDTARDTAVSETASDSTANDAASSDSGQEATADSTSGAKTGEIIAFSVVGAIVIAAIIVLIVTLVSRRRKATANGADDFDEDDEDEDEDGNE